MVHEVYFLDLIHIFSEYVGEPVILQSGEVAALDDRFYTYMIISSKKFSNAEATGSVSAGAVSHASKQKNKLPKDKSRGQKQTETDDVLVKN